MNSNFFLPFLLMFLMIFIAMIVGFWIVADTNEGVPTQMAAGTYEALSVAKGFDTQTGEPIYYIVARPFKLNSVVDPKTQKRVTTQIYPPIKLYKVAQISVKNLIFDPKPDIGFHYQGLLQVSY